MRKKVLIIFISLLISTMIYHLGSRILYAQQISLGISPPLLNMVIKPGKSVMIAYRIENNGDPTIMLVKILPFEPQDNLGNIRIKDQFDGPIRFNLDNADLQMEQPFFLKSQDSQQILLRIRVPDGAPEGDYYYTLLAEAQPPPTVEGIGSARAKAAIGSNILITVSQTGMVQVKGKIAIFDVLPRYTLNLPGNKIRVFDSNDKIPVVLIVDNQGKNLLTPEGQITLKGNFGEKAQYDIIPKNLLAESQRLLIASESAQINCPDNPPLPSYCKSPITLLLSGFFVGLYRLSTTITFGENSPQIFGSTSFVAIPFKLTIGFIVALLIGIVVIKKIQKKNEED